MKGLFVTCREGSSLFWLQDFEVEDRVLQRNGLCVFSHNNGRGSALNSSSFIASSCLKSQRWSVIEYIHCIDYGQLFPAPGGCTIPWGVREEWLVLVACRCKKNAQIGVILITTSNFSEKKQPSDNNNLKFVGLGVPENCCVKDQQVPKELG